MTLLITGGAGCLAGDFLDYWQANRIEEDLVLVDDFSQPSISSLDVTSSHVLLISGDCGNAIFLKELLTKYRPRAILHFASSMESGEDGYYANIQTLLATIKAASGTGSPAIFYPQSFLTRNCSEMMDDSSPINPETGEYPIFKSICEYYLQTYSGRSIVGVISTTLSPRLSIGPIPAFTKRLLSRDSITVSDTSRDYVSPSAVVEAIILTLDETFVKQKVIIASGQSTSTMEIYDVVSKTLGLKTEIDPELVQPKKGDPKVVTLVPSQSLILKGWNPRTLHEESLYACIKSAEKSTLKTRQHHVN